MRNTNCSSFPRFVQYIHLLLKCYSKYYSKVVQFTDFSVVSRFLSSARSARQTRARPMPNFEQLHEKWGRLMENRKQSAYKPTVVSVTYCFFSNTVQRLLLFIRVIPVYVKCDIHLAKFTACHIYIVSQKTPVPFCGNFHKLDHF